MTEILGFGSDICLTFDSSSLKTKLLSRKLLESNPALKIQDCNFSNSISKHRGGSLYLSVSNAQASRSFEINKCLFKEITTEIGGSIDIQSTNPKVMFHFFDCDFEKECSIFFNAVTGHLEKCRFNDIKDNIPIHYECNTLDQTTEDQSLRIEYCNFTQTKEIYSLVFFVPKPSSRFEFSHNEIDIPNNKTFVFNCNSDAKLEGTWNFEDNKLNPDNELLINSENATSIQFKASCRRGFMCTPQFVEPVPGYECEKNKHCYVNGNDQASISFIEVSDSNYNGLKDEKNQGGAAIHLINYGIICNNSKFTSCIAEAAAGGGVYIYLSEIINNPISFYDVTFSKCSAIYGGAVYIYSSVDNDIKFTLCNFIENKANKKSEAAGKNLYGGAALFLQLTCSEINKCIFKKNIGSGVKIINEFENNLKTIKELDSLISIENCQFEMDKKSESSIFFVSEEKMQIPVHVKDCIFKGKLSKKAFHIDGVSNLRNKMKSKLRIEFCRFSTDKNKALNLNSIIYSSFDESSQKFNWDEKNKKNDLERSNWKSISGLLVSSFALMAIVAVVVIKIKRSIKNYMQNNENTNEIDLA